LKYETDEENKRGVAGMTPDQIIEVAEEVRKKDTNDKKEQDSKNKWELNRALGTNQKAYI
jgi:hypothetical protein